MEVNLQTMYEGVQSLRQAIDKGWADQKAEVNAALQAEVKRIGEEIDKRFAEAQKVLDEREVERRMSFGSDDSDACKYGEPPMLRKQINEIKREFMGTKGGGKLPDMRFQNFLSLIASGYQGQVKHPLLDKLPRMVWSEDGIQTKRLLEDAGFFDAAMTSTGGYLVFPEYMAEIVPLLRQGSVIRRLARVVPMSGLLLYWPVCTTGSTWAWIAEDGAKVDNDFIFNFGVLRNHMMYSITYVSNQMLADSRPSVEAYIREDFGLGAAVTEDTAFINGTGVAGNPITGIIADATVPTVAALAVFDYDDLITAWATVNTALFGPPVRPALLANSAAIAHLAAVKDLQNNYIWKEPLTGTLDGSIGRLPFVGPCYVDENLATAAGPPTSSTLIYGDWNEAMIGDREEMIIMPNPYETVAFQHNAVAFRAERRVGWALRRPTAFVKITGALL